MIRTVLKEVRSSRGPINLTSLSRKLSIDKDTLKAMLVDLERMGKINTNFASEENGFSGCQSSGLCSFCVHSCKRN